MQTKGESVADNDLWMASCVVRHSIPLVSNNRKHFDKVPDLNLISEEPAIEERPNADL
jgi:predicted nucleic acid-binding protein